MILKNISWHIDPWFVWKGPLNNIIMDFWISEWVCDLLTITEIRADESSVTILSHPKYKGLPVYLLSLTAIFFKVRWGSCLVIAGWVSRLARNGDWLNTNQHFVCNTTEQKLIKSNSQYLSKSPMPNILHACFHCPWCIIGKHPSGTKMGVTKPVLAIPHTWQGPYPAQQPTLYIPRDQLIV